MGFTRPIALLLASLLVLVWWLHRTSKARPRIPLHAPFLLPERKGAKASGAAGRRDLLHLLVRMGIALALVLGAAGPWVRERGPARAVGVVPAGIDMALPYRGGTRFQAALDELAGRFEALSPGKALVLLAGPSPVAASSWTSWERAVDAARRAAPSMGPTRVTEAMREARRLAGDKGEVLLVRVGTEPLPDDVGLAGLWFVADRRRTNHGVIGMAVRNHGPAKAVKVKLDTLRGPLATVAVRLGDGEQAMVTVDYTGPGHTAVRARIVTPDPFPLDDEAWTAIPPLGPRRVTLLTRGNDELARAIRAIPRVELQMARELPDDPGVLVVVDRVQAHPRPGIPAVIIHRPTKPNGVPITMIEPRSRAPGLRALAGLVPETVAALPEVGPEDEIVATVGGRPALVRGPGRVHLAFDPGSAGLGGSPLHAALWDDLLDPLLLPPLDGCQRATPGDTTPIGPIAAPGFYRDGDGCYVANVPPDVFPEPRPSEVTERSPREGRDTPLTPWFFALALALLLVEPPVGRWAEGGTR